MTAETADYLAFLAKVETALDEALDTGRVPEDDPQRAELEWMRSEVAATRQALCEQEQATSLPSFAAAK